MMDKQILQSGKLYYSSELPTKNWRPYIKKNLDSHC